MYQGNWRQQSPSFRTALRRMGWAATGSMARSAVKRCRCISVRDWLPPSGSRRPNCGQALPSWTSSDGCDTVKGGRSQKLEGDRGRHKADALKSRVFNFVLGRVRSNAWHRLSLVSAQGPRKAGDEPRGCKCALLRGQALTSASGMSSRAPVGPVTHVQTITCNLMGLVFPGTTPPRPSPPPPRGTTVPPPWGGGGLSPSDPPPQGEEGAPPQTKHLSADAVQNSWPVTCFLLVAQG